MRKTPRQVQNFSILGSRGKRRIVSFEGFAQLLKRYQSVKFLLEFFGSKLFDFIVNFWPFFKE